MSLESDFSNDMEAILPDGPPAAPIIKNITFAKGVAQVVVTLPSNDADGGILTGLANCYVFVKESSFEGSSPAQERAAGTPVVAMPIDMNMMGQDITVFVNDLKYGKTYHFAATCAD